MLKMDLKKCSHCKELKHVSCFYKNSSKKDGLSSDCKDCNKKIKSDHKAKNIESVRKKDRDRRRIKECFKIIKQIQREAVDFLEQEKRGSNFQLIIHKSFKLRKLGKIISELEKRGDYIE